MIRSLFIIILIFFISVGIRLLTINEIGRTWDEHFYINDGYKMIKLLSERDLDNSFFYTSYDHPPLVKYLYGITAYYDLSQYDDGVASFEYDLTYSRILSLVVYSIGVVLTIFIGWRIRSLTVGVYAGLILALLPFSLGLSQLVTAESFKILIYPLAILSYFLLLKDFTWKKILIAGIITGIAIQIKQSNILLVTILGLGLIFQYKLEKIKDKKKYIKTRIIGLVTIAFISIVTFIVFWPHILFHFNEVSTKHNSLWSIKFSPSIWHITLAPPEVFMGRLMPVPNFYYIVYFFISIPIVIIFLFFAGILNIIRRINLQVIMLILWFLVPFAMSLYSWRQHGLRYIIEIYPAIALIAAIGFEQLSSNVFEKNEIRKKIAFGFVVLYLLFTLWQIKPYYLDYFNELVGGTNAVHEKNLFQTGWWGQGLREAGLYIIDNAHKDSSVGLAISPDHVLPQSPDLKYEAWSVSESYDYVIVNHYHIIRDGFDDSTIRENYNLIYTVNAGGAELVYVYKR